MATATVVVNKLIARDGIVAHSREVILIFSAYFAYMIVRKAIAADIGDVAVANAETLIGFEKNLGFFWEPVWQQWAMDSGRWLMVLFNWIYIVTFFPIVLSVALAYYIFDRDRYFYYRSVILLSFAVALVIFAILPVAPPRMMPDHGFVDSIKQFGPIWYAGRGMMSYYNAFAAMPSLHFAWTVIFGVLFFRQGGLFPRFLGFLYPTITLFAIAITGNHYILDAVVGGAMMLVTYLLYEIFFNRGIILRIRPSFTRPNFNLPVPVLKKNGNGRVRTRSSGSSV
jgi:hypothetical protein